MLMLAMMGVIGLAALDTVTLDLRTAAYQGRKRVSFYAAEAGVAEALASLASTGTPSVSVTSLSDPASYPNGQPQYDLAPGTNIEKLGDGTIPGMAINIGQGGASTYQIEYWKFEIQGQEQAGTTSRIQVAAGRFVGS